jgi:hypothetical protein
MAETTGGSVRNERIFIGRIPAHRAPRWDHRRRMKKALELLLDPRLDGLVSGGSDFEDLPETLAKLSRDPAGALCHVRYRHDSPSS